MILAHAGWGIEVDRNEMQIKWEDSFIGNKRVCQGCELILDPAEMLDITEDGFIFKVCKECK